MTIIGLIVIGICGLCSGWFLGYAEHGFVYMGTRSAYFSAFVIGTVAVLWLEESATAALLGMIVWSLSGGTGYKISMNKLDRYLDAKRRKPHISK